ncbi:MAG: NADPH-dependent FMN reductase [Pseudomonadota bacterium]
MSILLLAGSPSLNSRSSGLLKFIGNKLNLLGYSTKTVTIRDIPAEPLLHANIKDESLSEALNTVNVVDAIVLATPIYKAAYSGLLKVFLDVLPQNGLENKYILPVGSGGSAHHTLALDYGLRPVLTSLSAKNILPSIYALDAHFQVDKDGAGATITDDLTERINNGVERLHEHLLALQRNKSIHFNHIQFSNIKYSV